MSTVEKNQQFWSGITDTPVDSKYEKCRNITEEIYKRINITFEIKKLEEQSEGSNELSDQIDSNEISNETDLFAYDKSTSISSSLTDLEAQGCQKYINLNNNEETKYRRTTPIIRPVRPKKKFRKRVKKRQQKNNQSDTDCSSDEGLPLSRIIVDLNATKSNENSLDTNTLPATAGGSNLEQKCSITVNNTDLGGENKILEVTVNTGTEKSEKLDSQLIPTNLDNISVDKEEVTQVTELPVQKSQATKSTTQNVLPELKNVSEALNLSIVKNDQKIVNPDWKYCPLCQLSFRGERGLKRHMTMSHVMTNDGDRVQPIAQADAKETFESVSTCVNK